ncbi:hypothetical protein ABIB40_003231 [Pedobacter sp. UYP30]|uniref:hypothetical protein n=1 Tax=Pedobacter sp. UYP30 TaxID=1756400 RepID=UPI00339A0B7B
MKPTATVSAEPMALFFKLTIAGSVGLALQQFGGKNAKSCLHGNITLLVRRGFAAVRWAWLRKRPRIINVKQLGEFLPKGMPALIFVSFYQEKERRPSG